MTDILTACTRRCPDTCSMIAKRENGRVVSFSGNPDSPYTRGSLCKSQESYLENVTYHRERILHAHRRDVNTWTSWKMAPREELITELADHLKTAREKYGSKTILHIQGDGYPGISRHLNTLFFRALGGVRRVTPDLESAAGLTGQAQDFGEIEVSDPKDILNSKLIILWGKNVAQSAIHLNMYVQQARKRGAKTILIDPVYGPSIKYADAHYQIAPGADSSLALAMAHHILKNHWFDEAFCNQYVENFSTFKSAILSLNPQDLCKIADLAPGVVENLARLMATTRPAMIITGRGLTRTRHGGQAVRLIDALAVITGQIGVSGGGVFFHRREQGLNLSLLESMEYPGEKICSPADLPAILTGGDPPVSAVFINHANPILEWPSGQEVARALSSVPVIVVMDTHLNDTADCATHFLPVPTMVERQDIVFSPYHPEILMNQMVIPPRAGCATEFSYYQALARRLEAAHPVHPYWWYMHQMMSHFSKQGVTIDRLRKETVSNPFAKKVAYDSRQFKTESGKIELISRWELKGKREKKFPLTVVSPSLRKWCAQTVPGEQQEESLVAILHPDTLEKLKLEPGQHAKLMGPSGSVIVVVQDDSEQRQDTVVVPFGKWVYLGGNVSTVVPLEKTDLGKGVVFQGTGVMLR